ncbi:MAG: hypothetical protein QM764_22870 [Chitinophagaceae bacterium]
MRNKFFNPFHFLALFFLFAVTIPGCKKEDNPGGGEDSPGNYYIKFKADGQQKTFEKDAVSLFNASDADTLFSTILGGGLEENNNKSNFFAILLGTSKPVVTGDTYVNFLPAPSGSVMAEALGFTYNDADKKSFADFGDGISYFLYGVHSDGHLQITELTTEYAKGTFSGLLFNVDTSIAPSSAERILITEGKFYLKRVQ